MSEQSAQRRESGLVVEGGGAIRLLTLDRPERRNALSTAIQADLVEQLLAAPEDGGRGVVPTGGGRAFCAGCALRELGGGGRRGEPFRPPMNRPGRNLFEV